MRLLIPTALCAGLALGGYSLGLAWNATPSMPVGVWRVTALREVARGAAVTVCLPEAAARLGVTRGYLDAGDCPGAAELLIKPLAAVPGDQVVVSDAGITVNGVVQPNSRALARDDAGRTLTAAATGIYTVPPGEVWIVSGNDERSYDSRYYGPVAVTSLRGSATPWLTIH